MRRRFKGFQQLLPVIILACGSSPVLASDETSDDDEMEYVEPIVGEETMPNEVGEWELEVSAHYVKDGRETVAVLPDLSLSFGLAERFGGELSLPLVHRHNDGAGHYDVGPLSVGLKLLLREPELRGPAVTVGLEVEFPTGDEVEFPVGEAITEEAERNYEITPSVGLLAKVGRATLQGDFGWSLGVPKSQGPTSQSVVYNWGLSVPLWHERTHVMLEFNGEIGVRNAEDTASVAPGIRHLWEDDVSVAVALPFGLNENTPGWALLLQWQMEF